MHAPGARRGRWAQRSPGIADAADAPVAQTGDYEVGSFPTTVRLACAEHASVLVRTPAGEKGSKRSSSDG